MLKIIKDYTKNNFFNKIFCCSDDESFINDMKNLYPNKIISYDQIRKNFRYGQKYSEENKDNNTYACFIDMVGLSKCGTVIKNSSALSAFSKIINPSLNIFTVSAMKQKWFPTGVIKVYKTKSNKIKKILARTMKRDCYNLNID